MPQPKLMHSEISPPGEDLALAARSLFHLFPRWDMRVFGMVDSTNAEARRIALLFGGDAWQRLIVADHQTAGRGRNGRKWISPARKSLLATIMAPKAAFPVPPGLLPICVATWAEEGLLRTGLEGVELKWPNDLLVRGQKIGGILCETCGEAVLLGIGINIDQTREELPERSPLEPQATSIALELGERHPGRLACLISLAGAMLECIENPGKIETVLEHYRRRCVTFGQTVGFRDAILGHATGIARDIDDSGALIVEVPGHGRRLATGLTEVDGSA